MLKRWEAFARFLDDGRICLTNNAAERALRGIALGRKAWLFAGSDEGASYCSSHHAFINAEDFVGEYQAAGVVTGAHLLHYGRTRHAKSAWRMIHGAPLHDWVAGRAPLAIRRRTVVVLMSRTTAASLIVASPRSARSPGRWMATSF